MQLFGLHLNNSDLKVSQAYHAAAMAYVCYQNNNLSARIGPCFRCS